jgi:ferrous iron transport protein A
MTVALSHLRPSQRGTVAAVDWDRLAEAEGRRLRELGIDEGAEVEVLHQVRLGGGPIACRVGRMTVALRRAVAGVVHVATTPAS